MTSTIHIFDEYAMPVEILRDSQRHTKRIQLEKLIFSILKTRYGKFFQDFWTSYFPPVTSKKQIVIVERRIHENLEFIPWEDNIKKRTKCSISIKNLNEN